MNALSYKTLHDLDIYHEKSISSFLLPNTFIPLFRCRYCQLVYLSVWFRVQAGKEKWWKLWKEGNFRNKTLQKCWKWGSLSLKGESEIRVPEGLHEDAKAWSLWWKLEAKYVQPAGGTQEQELMEGATGYRGNFPLHDFLPVDLQPSIFDGLRAAIEHGGQRLL